MPRERRSTGRSTGERSPGKVGHQEHPSPNESREHLFLGHHLEAGKRKETVIVMKKLLLLWMVGFIFVIHIGNVEAGTTSSVCLNNTSNEGQCKDCCDCLEVDAATRRSCRDACSVNEFSLNADFISVSAPSKLGPDGDYSAALDAGNEQACKEYCDGSDDLACGDRHYCRDACNAAGFTNFAPNKTRKSDNKGLPPEIVGDCQGKNEQVTCHVGETFAGTCKPLRNQLACVLSQWVKLQLAPAPKAVTILPQG